ncbi:MAG: hypothetical protein HC886_20175 [Leptolyngbyaceae cyanobacterium SM1_1_3]|nr:hypothetical protein [Leptolyngbyaceae cyanobacterium SM1_1_3]
MNSFRKDIESTSIEIPEDNIDVSYIFAFYDFSEGAVQEVVQRMLRFLNNFEIVNTNRLHICIASALLGKKVNFYANSYYKNESVYNFSIKDRLPNVAWMG